MFIYLFTSLFYSNEIPVDMACLMINTNFINFAILPSIFWVFLLNKNSRNCLSMNVILKANFENFYVFYSWKKKFLICSSLKGFVAENEQQSNNLFINGNAWASFSEKMLSNISLKLHVDFNPLQNINLLNNYPAGYRIIRLNSDRTITFN